MYYNDSITPHMGLMEATATAEEIRFGLRVEDIVITKDSVPAAPAGCGMRRWGRDGLGTGARGMGARARRAFVLPSL